MPGRALSEIPNPISQTQKPGMSPVYQGAKGEKEFVGYAYDVNSTPVEVPKPASILAEEKRLGIEMKPVYATMNFGQGNTIQYGPPTHYEFDNGNDQIINRFFRFGERKKYFKLI